MSVGLPDSWTELLLIAVVAVCLLRFGYALSHPISLQEVAATTHLVAMLMGNEHSPPPSTIWYSRSELSPVHLHVV